jgi:dephospho-CoA kinase
VTLVVGLTGNIASGKTTVASLLAAKGATVIDADALAREAVAPHTPALAAIAARWPSVLAPDGTLDRAALRRIVFADRAARAALDAIVHPEVAHLRDAALTRARKQNARVIVYDVPLLFEAGLEREVDTIVLVDAPEHVRRARLMHKRGLSDADASAMLAAQMPASAKRQRAHHIIENDADLTALSARVAALWNALAPGQTPG